MDLVVEDSMPMWMVLREASGFHRRGEHNAMRPERHSTYYYYCLLLVGLRHGTVQRATGCGKNSKSAWWVVIVKCRRKSTMGQMAPPQTKFGLLFGYQRSCSTGIARGRFADAQMSIDPGSTVPKYRYVPNER